MTDETNVSEPAAENAHEPNTFNVRVAVYAVVGLIAISAVGFGVTYVLYQAFGQPVEREDELPEEFVRSRPAPPEPTWHRRTQDLEETRQAADEALNNYAWVDEEAGIARVPISRAMEMISEQGLPAKTESDKPETSEPPPAESGDTP